jgi:hypothetical protein
VKNDKTVLRIQIRMDPHHFGKLYPDPDPHQSGKQDPDPHQDGSLRGSFWNIGGSKSGKKSPDPHQIERYPKYPDPHQSEKQDLDPHQSDANPQH